LQHIRPVARQKQRRFRQWIAGFREMPLWSPREAPTAVFRTDMNDRTRAILRAFVRDWLSIVAIAFVLALFGPYDTLTTMPPVNRVVFWQIAALATAVLVRGVRRALQFFPWTKHWPFVPLRLTAAVLGSVPVTLLTAQAYAWLSGLPSSGGPGFGMSYVYVLLPTAVFSLVLIGRSPPWFLPDPPPPAPAENDKIDRVDPATAFLVRHVSRFATGTLLALESEDHYLRVHTDQGSELILMRLRDAMAQLVEVPGLQVHRSFWVARAAVAQTQRRGNGWQLILRNGSKVPVSRTYGTALREAGWLATVA